MMKLDTIEWVGAIEPITLALLIGSMVLTLFVIPLFFDTRAGEGRIRRSMIERHRVRLKKESMRRGRFSASDKPLNSLERIMGLVALLPDQIKGDKQKLLRSAGYSDQQAIVVFWSVKLVLGFGSMVFLSIFLLSGGGEWQTEMALAVGCSIFAAISGPDIFVKWRRKTRLRNIERALPDGLDLLVICAEAGLSLDAGLKRVADEFITVVPELAEELLLTSVELNFLPDRRQALANLAQRADVAAFRGVTATLIQTEKYGTPLAQALRTLATESRENRLLHAEEKAARLPAILTVPMIVFILPALFIVLAAPAFIKVAEKIGN
jgi:tight adherence protein C